MTTTGSDVQQFEQILQYLQQTRGFDFTAYKRSSLTRRVLKRMHAVGISGYEEYFDYLQVHQDEFSALFNTILINVTSFFRDPDVWEYLRAHILPQLVSDRASGSLRVWSAGAASGQEAYTIVMLLAELIGADAVRERLKVYATDVDEDALSDARLGTYSERAVEGVPPPLLEKYFVRSGSEFSFDRDLRRTMIFGRHDLVQDAPISRVDLLMCRNTIMYFNADAQEKMLARFHFSLNPGAYIVLGRAEMLFSHGDMFEAVDLKRRVFRAAGKSLHREKLFLGQAGREAMPVEHSRDGRLREAAFESDQEPVIDDTQTNIGTRIHFKDVTDLRALQTELQHSKQELETAYEELQSTNEELETTNEELQATVEKLETTNEELQSTNEELKTMNEELQSTNEELQTMNEELHNRTETQES